MEEEKIKIPLVVTKEEFRVLLTSLDLYNQIDGFINYGQCVEDCQNLKNQLLSKFVMKGGRYDKKFSNGI